MLYYQDNSIHIFNGDCREMDLPNERVQCVVTSPPYWGLRKYAGLPDLVWGDNHCGHQWGDLIPNPMCKSGKHGPASILTKTADEQHAVRKESNQGSFCSLCGTWKGQYGLEPTPEMYIQHTIGILREIRRVLRKDGVVFWNIGDSYVSGKSRYSSKPHTISGGKDRGDNHSQKPDQYYHPILKDKDLCLIPFRVAIAAQEDGWWVRSIIIWSKPNPMPESVTDRPTESHEYILMLTKSARYYFDQDAVREPVKDPDELRYRYQLRQSKNYDLRNTDKGQQWADGSSMTEEQILAGRNIRSVWEFPTQPYPEAHFAVFPEKLPEICIKAASKPDDLVLDPFMGSGTTLWMAKKLGRRGVGYELSEEYCQLALERNRQQVMELSI